MDIEPVESHGTMIFRVREKIHADSEIDEIAVRVERELEQGRKKIALSFLPNTYPYSPVLGTLARCHRSAERFGVRLAVIAHTAEFIDILMETRLDRIFDIWRSEKEAVQ
jgi:hypothetical protein